MRHVPAISTFAALLALPFADHPIAIATILIAMGALTFTGFPNSMRWAIIMLPLMLFSESFENKGATALAFLNPRLLEHPAFAGDSPYWRPGLAAVFGLLALGGLVGRLLSKLYRHILGSEEDDECRITY